MVARWQHPYWDLAALLQDDWDLGRPVGYVRRAERYLASVLARYP